MGQWENIQYLKETPLKMGLGVIQVPVQFRQTLFLFKMGLESNNETVERTPIKDGARGLTKYIQIIRNKAKQKPDMP